MNDEPGRLSAEWGELTLNAPPTDEVFENYMKELGKQLPASYSKFMSFADGAKGFVGQSFLRLWRLDELQEGNRQYGFANRVPDLVAIGTNGGNEGYAISRRVKPGAIVSIPLTGLRMSDAIVVAKDFDSLFAALETNDYFDEDVRLDDDR